MKRLMLSAMNSGAGKTAAACTLMAALKESGASVRGFKCGPDYIDPMFHTRVLGVPGRNLDLFLQGESAMRHTLFRCSADFGILEGAMGFYDGLSGTTENSAWDIALKTGTPVLLVLQPRGTLVTLSAQVQGLLRFREESCIRALLLTNCKESLAEKCAAVLERETHLPVLGFLPALEALDLPSRHLGLWTPDEIADLSERFSVAARELKAHADLSRLTALMEESPAEQTAELPENTPLCRIAVARDEAFCFLYEDSLDALRDAGAEPVFFSPLRDASLPSGIDGLYLCGGYPELFASALANNEGMRRSILEAVKNGLPTVAECGGFLYLQQELEDGEGSAYPMCGALPGRGFRTGKLQRFGYQWLTGGEDSLLFRRDEQIPAHEFHYWASTCPGADLLSRRPDGTSWPNGRATPVLYAGFPHLHLGGEAPLARRFVNACR